MVEVVPAPAKAAKKQRVDKPRTGPSLSDRIVTVVSASNERGGVSGAAIKRALTAGGYDVERNNGRVKLALRTLVLKGTLIQAKGSGASGSFKISRKAAEPKAKRGTKKTVKTKKSSTPTKKPVAKKPPKKTKKSATPTKKPAAKKTPKKAKKPATKKTTKSPKRVAKKTSAAKKSPVKRVSKPKTKKAAPKKK